MENLLFLWLNNAMDKFQAMALFVRVVETGGISRAATVATFADPSTGPALPLFAFNSSTGTLFGAWHQQGLLLQTPLFSPASYPNAQFSMTPLGSIGNFGNIYHMGGGQINFATAANAPLLSLGGVFAACRRRTR